MAARKTAPEADTPPPVVPTPDTPPADTPPVDPPVDGGEQPPADTDPLAGLVNVEGDGRAAALQALLGQVDTDPTEADTPPPVVVTYPLTGVEHDWPTTGDSGRFVVRAIFFDRDFPEKLHAGTSFERTAMMRRSANRGDIVALDLNEATETAAAGGYLVPVEDDDESGDES